ncbi:MAG: carboxypeptidase-like regulatory domain-containing protein, partial [Bacteroidota bacterium]|nr:carboxypeptidase-like regulatory domain-containing protein [Bacteroidota bacterium]
MSLFHKLSFILLLLFTVFMAQAQSTVKGKIIDAVTKEPIAGATIHCTHDGCTCGCATNINGEFELKTKETCCNAFSVSFIGYQAQQIDLNAVPSFISLTPSTSSLNEVVISANRQAVKRSEAPVAITNINTRMLQDAKPSSVEQVLNKVSGVYMVNLGNEQHQMSIRQ